MNEVEEALLIAERVLDRPNGDPDDDLAVLARQLRRAHERLEGKPKTGAKKSRSEELAEQLVSVMMASLPYAARQVFTPEQEDELRKLWALWAISTFQSAEQQRERRKLGIDWRLFFNEAMMQSSYNEGVLAALGLKPEVTKLGPNGCEWMLVFKDEAESKRVAALLRVPE